MRRYTMSSPPARLAAILLVAAALAAVFLLWARGRRRLRPEDEPGEDVGHGPEGAALAAPEPVQLGADIPPRSAGERWDDLSDRRRLPVGEYRAALDERETEPGEAP